MPPFIEKVTLREVRLIFRNFAGAEKEYNEKGKRNFGVMLDDKTAEDMARAGWNIKFLQPREEGDAPVPWIKVNVNYGNQPPRIVLVTHKGRNVLDEQDLLAVDYADIANADVTLNPYRWKNKRGESGVSAYLRTCYAHLNEDPLDLEYEHLPEVDGNGRILELESGQLALEGGEEWLEGEVIDEDIEEPQKAIAGGQPPF